MYYFLLQTEPNGAFPELSSAIYEACQQQNWLDMAKDNICVWDDKEKMFRHAREILIPKYGAEHVVPIGSVEFTSEYLRALGRPPLRALNIPPELEDEKYLQRKIFHERRKDDLFILANMCGKLYIKPERTPKLFDTVVYNKGSEFLLDDIPDNEPLVVSSALPFPIVAEWRLICQYGKIISAHPYILDQWETADKKLCEEMASKLSRYQAITLDVAVLEDGSTVALEVHNCLACGLYGFEGPALLRVTKIAWRNELSAS